ncbi:DNA-binding transcriptional regulator, AcrR family [Nocardioides scoriae]|uniref:DNA-binding transcriptional regulator, AcrR family n=1 Tax=Nocardioides scoriae TaxID=642780 RepID=A0A1H1VJ75_9ACTN|nr:TetR/AcrR family transcriptional regulator [Nocardioides scoriae]SDS84783.1 DNA-binding transcriptional regulator, AcrR family [Nocardioides scoriae]
MDAALVVFGEFGYHGAQMDNLGAAAGTTKQTLYDRIGGKEQVYSRVLEREAQLLSKRLRVTYESSVDLSLHDLVQVAMGAFFDFGTTRRVGLALLLGTTRGGPATHIGHDLVNDIIGFLTEVVLHRTASGSPHLTASDARILAAACVGAARQVCETALELNLDINSARDQVSALVEAGLRSL